MGALKVGLGFAVAAVVAALLLVAAAGARARGNLSYCRNNLRRLGEMAFQKLGSEEQVEATGRRFWQQIRFEYYSRPQGGKDVWFIKSGGLNPFGCPVRGVRPLDLSALSAEELERHMSDPSTIDYRGPKRAPEGAAPGLRPLGGDLPGNHPHGGHVLLIDLSIRDVRDAVKLKDSSEVPEADGDLSE
ncbi:MAG TPA: hypothetical protein VGK61_08470 [Planctomycetota bacterium]|jgi:hypothetical protein